MIGLPGWGLSPVGDFEGSSGAFFGSTFGALSIFGAFSGFNGCSLGVGAGAGDGGGGVGLGAGAGAGSTTATGSDGGAASCSDDERATSINVTPTAIPAAPRIGISMRRRLC